MPGMPPCISLESYMTPSATNKVERGVHGPNGPYHVPSSSFKVRRHHSIEGNTAGSRLLAPPPCAQSSRVREFLHFASTTSSPRLLHLGSAVALGVHLSFHCVSFE